MGMLTNKDYGTTPLERVLAPGIKRVSLGDVREADRKAGENGEAKGPLSRVMINLNLEEPAKTTDGDTVGAGFPFLVTINEWEGRQDEARAELREFALAVLGKERASKDDVVAAVDAAGGYVGLKGRHLLVELSVSKKGFQEVKAYNRVPVTAQPA